MRINSPRDYSDINQLANQAFPDVMPDRFSQSNYGQNEWNAWNTRAVSRPEDYRLQTRDNGEWRITVAGSTLRTSAESDPRYTGQQFLAAYQNYGVSPDLGLSQQNTALAQRTMFANAANLDPRTVVMPSPIRMSGSEQGSYDRGTATIGINVAAAQRSYEGMLDPTGARSEYDRAMLLNQYGVRSVSKISPEQYVGGVITHELGHAADLSGAPISSIISSRTAELAQQNQSIRAMFPSMPGDLREHVAYTRSRNEQVANMAVKQMAQMQREGTFESTQNQQIADLGFGGQAQGFRLSPLEGSNALPVAALRGIGRNKDISEVNEGLDTLRKTIQGMGEVLPKVNEGTSQLVKSYQSMAGGVPQPGGVGGQALYSFAEYQAAGGRGGGGGSPPLMGGGYLPPDESGFGRDGGGVGGAIGHFAQRAIQGQGLFRARLGFRIYAGPAMEAEQQYVEQQAMQNQLMLQSGQMSYQQFRGGAYGSIMQRQVGMEQFQLGIGGATNAAYGGLINMLAGGAGQAQGSLLAALGGIGGPAMGAGVALTQLTGSPALGTLGLGATALAGLAGYMGSNANNYLAIGGAQNAMRQQGIGSYPGQFISNFQGVMGSVGGLLGAVTAPTEEARQAQLDRLQRSGIYASEVAMAGAGTMDIGAISQHLESGGFNAGQIRSDIYASYQQQAANAGIGTQLAGQIYGAYARYRPGNAPTRLDRDRLAELSFRGVDVGQLISTQGGYMSAMGMNPNNTAIGGQTQDQLSQWLLSQQNAGMAQGNLDLISRQFSGANMALTSAGLGPVNLMNIAGNAGLTNASNAGARMGAMANALTGMGGLALSNQGLFAAGGGSAFSTFYGMAQAGQVAESNIAQQAWMQFVPQIQQGVTRGAFGAERGVQFLNQYSLAPEAQRNAAAQIMNRDPYALSTVAQMAAVRGDTSKMYLNTIDPNTGLGAYEENINFNEFQQAAGTRAGQYGLFKGITERDLAGGVSGMQNQIRVMQQENQAFQLARQGTMAGMGAEMAFGTANLAGASVTNEGVVVSISDKSFDNFKKMFADLGLGQFNAGNGMSMNQVQDAQRRLSREQQDYGMRQQGQQLALGDEQFAMQGRQFNERWNFGMQRLQWQTGFQREEMNISRQRQQTGFQWQESDMAFQRNVNAVQFGWQMEDFDRNIRYARGRERRDLMRGQERAVIMHSMQEGHADEQEGRLKTQEKWADEDFARKKKYFEEGVRFQVEEMQMQKRHFEEGRRLEEQSRQMNRQSYEMKMRWIQQERALEDQAHVLQVQAQMVEIQNSIQMNQKAQQMNADVTRLTNNINGFTMAAADNAAKSGTARGMLDVLTLAEKALGDAAINARSSVNSLASSLGGVGGSTYSLPEPGPGGGGPYSDGGFVPLPGYARGGFTGYGGRKQPMGVVHGGEYVVPQEGVPVVRGESQELVAIQKEVLSVLKRIADMGPGRVNATIVNSNAKAIPTSALTAKDKTYSRVH